MKRTLILLVFLAASLVSLAQRDSIRVVIECDSLYRPFLECSDVSLRLGVEDRYGSGIILDSDFSFLAPIPPKGKYYYVSITSILFHNSLLVLEEGDKLLNKKAFSFPEACEYNKFLINNTCTKCTLNDSVTAIQFGLAIYDLLPEDNYIIICNPYKNPVNPKGYSGGCQYDADACRAHWYCHRCKKEY